MKPGFIAELCIPEDADGARRVRRELVDELKEQKLFSKVDLLSDDLRRHLNNRPLRGVRNRSLSERWHKWRARRPYALLATAGVLAFLAAE